MKIYHDKGLEEPPEIDYMPDKVEDDEIRKYANLFKLKVEKNNVE